MLYFILKICKRESCQPVKNLPRSFLKGEKKNLCSKKAKDLKSLCVCVCAQRGFIERMSRSVYLICSFCPPRAR